MESIWKESIMRQFLLYLKKKKKNTQSRRKELNVKTINVQKVLMEKKRLFSPYGWKSQMKIDQTCLSVIYQWWEDKVGHQQEGCGDFSTDAIHLTVVQKGNIGPKSKLLIFLSIYIPNMFYGYELWKRKQQTDLPSELGQISVAGWVARTSNASEEDW